MRFSLVAGEASGDLLGGLLLQGLNARWPGLATDGIGGPRMQAQGFQSWVPYERLAVSGYVEVLRHLPGLLRLRRDLRERLAADPPQAFIGIDAPDFNLGLEASLRERGLRTVHFVCPSIWAWRAERVHKIRASADHVLCLFPFEPEILQKEGIAATYVGHPLANVIPQQVDRAAARAALGLPGEGELLAVLPGSRASEVARHALPFLAAARRVRDARPGLRIAVPAIPALRPAVERAAREAGLGAECSIFEGRSHEVLAACDMTLIASGTATLEAALFKRPMVIAYKVSPLTFRMMWPKRLQPWIGLPNVLCRDFVVPELVQEAANPESMARACLEWLQSPDKMAAISQRFSALHELLRRDTARLATDAIEKTIQA